MKNNNITIDSIKKALLSNNNLGGHFNHLLEQGYDINVRTSKLVLEIPQQDIDIDMDVDFTKTTSPNIQTGEKFLIQVEFKNSIFTGTIKNIETIGNYNIKWD